MLLCFLIFSSTFWKLLFDGSFANVLLGQWPHGVLLHANLTMRMSTTQKLVQKKKKTRRKMQRAALMRTSKSTQPAETSAPTVTGRIKEGQKNRKQKKPNYTESYFVICLIK